MRLHTGLITAALVILACEAPDRPAVTTVTLDSTGVVGWYTSVAIGTDGLGFISYLDLTNSDLKVAHLGIGVP